MSPALRDAGHFSNGRSERALSEVADGQGGVRAAGDWGDDLPVAEVQSLFVTLGTAFRAYQPYDDNNPVRQRFVESLRGEFTTPWAELNKLPLRVTEDHLFLPATGKTAHQIIKTTDPQKYGILVSDDLIA